MLKAGETIKGLAGTYRCDALHAEGGFGLAFAGKRTSDDAPVILKELRIERLKDWKAVELFEREATILKKLSHKQIPAYYDFFAWDGEKAESTTSLATRSHDANDAKDSKDAESGEKKASARTSLVLVQQRLSGESLAKRIESGAHLSSAEVERLLRGLLDILRYLHELHPPVIHRDINPANILVDAEGLPYLVDFGGVQDRLRLASGGSTQIGTVGYMPIEQLSGAARPTTDLYALGMTMLTTLSHVPPHEMPIDEETSKVKVAELVPTLDPKLREAIDKMVEPLASRRAKSAADLIAALDSKATTKAAKAPEAIDATSSSAPPPLAMHTPEGKRHYWGMGALVVVAMVGGGYFVVRSRLPDNPTNQILTPTGTIATPTVATTEALDVPPAERKISAEWNAHVRSADSLPVKAGAQCTLRADLETFHDRYKYPKQRASNLTVRCGDKVIYTQKSKYLDSNVSDYPGDTPNTYRQTMEISMTHDADDSLYIGTNTLQSQFDIKRGGSDSFELKLFVEHLSKDSKTAMFAESEKLPVGFRPSRSRKGSVVTATGKAPVKAGATCHLTLEAGWQSPESDKEKSNCDVRLFCNDIWIRSQYGMCSNDPNFKFKNVSFNGVGEQRHEIIVDLGSNSVKYNDGVDPEDKYSLDIHLD